MMKKVKHFSKFTYNYNKKPTLKITTQQKALTSSSRRPTDDQNKTKYSELCGGKRERVQIYKSN